MKRFVSFVTVVCASIFIATSSFAYSLLSWKIGSDTLIYLPHKNFSSQSISDFNEALYEWNHQAGRTLMRREPHLRHSTSNYPKEDYSNRIYRLAVGRDKYLAQNSVSKENGIVVDSDININISHPYANGSFAGTFDTFSVFLHESGHTVGLGHSEYFNAVMYDTISSGVLKRTLHFDDRNGVNRIY